MSHGSCRYQLYHTHHVGICSVKLLQLIYLTGNKCLMVDISSLPSSVGSAVDLAKRADTKAAMEVSTMVSMGTPSETPTKGTVVNWKEKNDNA